ncbi:hypothetical protein F4V90_29745 [Neorhizobium galegae]|nr:hypothetical protein F4V90_29745 [Neorhizobium galegae]
MAASLRVRLRLPPSDQNQKRKTGWMLAEEAGLDRPYRIQSLLGRSSWSTDEPNACNVKAG